MSSRMEGASTMLRGVDLGSGGHVRTHDRARTWKVRDAEVEEGQKVRSQVARPKAHVSKVGLVATVGVDPPACGCRGMMMGLVHSRQVSSKPPRPHRRELPRAANSGSENTSLTVEKALMLKSPPMKLTISCTM